MAIEIVNFPIKNGGSFHSYVKLPEGKMIAFGLDLKRPLKEERPTISDGEARMEGVYEDCRNAAMERRVFFIIPIGSWCWYIC